MCSATVLKLPTNLDCNVRVIEVDERLACLKLPKYTRLASSEELFLIGPYKFSYTYPLSKTAVFDHVLTPDMNGLDLLVLARADYERIYREEDGDVGAPTPMIPGMLNRQQSDGRWGIWGHVIDDLFFEGIDIDHRKSAISFSMGS
jgi:hypothetical protein